MAVCFRNYTSAAGITEDYYKVREFFIKLGYAEYTYVRWDWMITHLWLDKSAVGRIGLWEDNGEVVGVATFDTRIGDCYCMTLPQYAFLKKELLLYAKDNLAKEGKSTVVISDQDLFFQNIAADLGYVATPGREYDAAFYLDQTSTAYELPEGFHVTTMKETYDLCRYLLVLWKGFNHELNGEGAFEYTKEKEEAAHQEMVRPNVDLSLKVAVVAPDGNFVSYCGMWYDPRAGFSVIEPVATDPDYRKKGMGKAAVLEGIRRVGELGAKVAYVGSSQQFYYSIGLRPYAASTIWSKK